MGVVSHVCVCVYTNDLEVPRQCVSSAVPFFLSSLLVLSFILCWLYSFHVVCNTNCKYFSATTIFLWHLCPWHFSPPYNRKCHRIQTKANFAILTVFIYLFTSFQVQDKSIRPGAYCFMLAFSVQIWPTSFKAQPERWFSYGMSLALAYYFSIWSHVKICSKKRTLLAYIIFVASWDVYFPQTEL